MRLVSVEDAVGERLAHDLTRIVPGRVKEVAFRRGHVILAKDVPDLRRIGKEQIYILDSDHLAVHEDEAAQQIVGSICAANLDWTGPREGKCSVFAASDGLLRIETGALERINLLGDIAISTLHTDFPCRQGQLVASARIIPLSIEQKRLDRVRAISSESGPIISLLPYRRLRVGAVVTGSEVYSGMIQDGFADHVTPKLEAYGATLHKKIVVPDSADAISEAISGLREMGCELILTTGGLSVDPDDVTRQGVRQSGAEIVSYGSPVMPGAMFLYAELGDVPVLGLPACVFYFPATILDLLLPRVLCGEELTAAAIARLGHGGLCLQCDSCRFPRCQFGK
ncbi:MAG: molybdopterin-binding protein [Desulfohalobiaceae bacterium]